MINDEYFTLTGHKYVKVHKGPYKGTVGKWCEECQDFFPWIPVKEEDCPYCKESKK